MKTNLKHQSVIGFVGMAKNTGKTTTLNHVIDLYDGQVSLTSIGLDGERIDQLTALPKPAICVTRGMVVATAKQTLGEASAALTILEQTPLQTALGPIIIVRIEQAGTICVAGPTTNRDLQWLIHRLRTYHNKVLIDGALARRTFVGIENISGIILATGAAVSADMDETLMKTQHVERLFSLPRYNEGPSWPTHASLLYIDEGRPVFWLKKNYDVLLEIKERLDKGGTLFIRGAITSRFTSFLKTHRMGGFNVVATDATKYTLSAREFAIFDMLHIKTYVMRQCPLLAITLNPWSPTGRHYDPSKFYQVANNRLNAPVYNVLERT